MQLQRTFKESYKNKLRDAVKSGEAIELYSKDSFEIDNHFVKRLANVYEPDFDIGEKMLETYDDDFKSAITLYEAYKEISPLLASSETFWVYLTHTTLFNYTQQRWPNVLRKTATSSYILDHWFMGGNGLLRNAAASLWWSIKCTYDEERNNRYELSEILFNNYTLRVNTFGISTIIRHKEAMIGILEYIKENPEVMLSFENRGRFISKYFNRLGGSKNLSSLDRNYFKKICYSLHETIMSITTREQTLDETLYYE
ncbi:hypothetical protein C7Y71_005440 [Pseudoprevotella muciniphila]|uniref:Uncharacterized protein n=1 Tax=Pseudoprevotella muciniphila TaxID=2133944 RepID=A0A5P8E6G9_9BACT|nr:DUF6339 family protein [Pseudoprevotella muciniphila]QFQ12500.1 hypothetical protein C7Y71_005440 [Pseudoprevotella muciniphila]